MKLVFYSRDNHRLHSSETNIYKREIFFFFILLETLLFVIAHFDALQFPSGLFLRISLCHKFHLEVWS